MAYTKIVAKHDRVTIDGTDYSNAFRTFGLESTDATVDVSGFSVTGVDETVPGARAQSFRGEMFITEETMNGVWPLHYNRTIVSIEWQPNGLVDANAPVFYGECTVNEFSPEDQRGSASTTPFRATTTDENGIQMAAGT